jgi:hypothetical protein
VPRIAIRRIVMNWKTALARVRDELGVRERE